MRKLPILYAIAMTGNELDAILCIACLGKFKRPVLLLLA
jgi:hypothetical protein